MRKVAQSTRCSVDSSIRSPPDCTAEAALFGLVFQGGVFYELPPSGAPKFYERMGPTFQFCRVFGR